MGRLEAAFPTLSFGDKTKQEDEDVQVSSFPDIMLWARRLFKSFALSGDDQNKCDVVLENTTTTFSPNAM